MLQFRSPGLYTQELPSGVRSVANAPTSVALFVGPTKSGIDARPMRLFNYGDYERAFGGPSQTSSLSYSVRHFFDNGGGEAWVVRVPADGAVAAKAAFKQDNAGGAEAFTLTSLSSGDGGSGVYVEIDPFGINGRPFDAAAATPKRRFNLVVMDPATGTVERLSPLTTSGSDARYASTVVNDLGSGSMLVKMTIPGAATDNEGPQATGSIYQVNGPFAAGTMAEDSKVVLGIDVPDAAGTGSDASRSLANYEVVVFKQNDPNPLTPLDLARAIGNAIAVKIAGDNAAAAKLAGSAVEVTPIAETVDGTTTTYLRVRMAAPTAGNLATRLAEATVTLSDPAAGNPPAKLMSLFGLVKKVENPSRYRLGWKYPAGQLVTGSEAKAVAGQAHGQPDSNVFRTAVNDLDKRDPFFNILCLPDVVRPASGTPTTAQHTNLKVIYNDAANICARKFAFLIVDPPPSVTTVGAAEAWKNTQLFASQHAAAFFPNIRVDDLLIPGSIRAHPPSGALAGVFARTDGQTGVWQSPAGTDAMIVGAYGPTLDLSDNDQGVLNPIGVNVIRRFPIYFTVNFGSRTLDGADVAGSDYKYIAVRRTASFILRSLTDSLRWAVHKGNGEALWGQLRVSVTGFMQGLFRQGAFKGTSPREAYFVACDASTTSPADIAAGVVNIRIGFAPLKPAEFVVITLQQVVQTAATA